MSTRRTGYLHLLMLVALVMVVSYHSAVRAWLPLVFPAMGVLFAGSASLAATALDRAESGRLFLRWAVPALLLPFWLLGAVAVTAMLVTGWTLEEGTGARALTWDTGWAWVLPLVEPPSSTTGLQWTGPLWFVGTYLWLLLLTPASLWLFRRWPLRLAAVPVVTLVLVALGVVNVSLRSAEVLVPLCTFAGCWLLGFAHADGRLRRLPLVPTVAAGAVLVGVGAWSGVRHLRVVGGDTIADVPLAHMLFAVGGVLVLLRLDPDRPAPAWLPDRGVLAFFGSRLVTMYVWANLAIAAAPFLLSRSPLRGFNTPDATGGLVRFATTWVLLLAAAVLLGWVEDVAAGRPVRLLPWRRRRPVAAPRPAVLFEDNAVAELPPEVVRKENVVMADDGAGGPVVPAQRAVVFSGNVVADPGPPVEAGPPAGAGSSVGAGPSAGAGARGTVDPDLAALWAERWDKHLVQRWDKLLLDGARAQNADA
ncbi:acyltransferase family protein [Blastococcus sp. SYSU DS0617]